MIQVLLICTAVLAVAASEAAAQSRGVRGILGREAPSWRVDRGFNLPDAHTSIDVDDFHGKVVYLYGFQSWCPGCHSRGASFLVDADGVLRFVHPGPVFFPSDDPRFERENNDYLLIERAVRRILAVEEGEQQ